MTSTRAINAAAAVIHACMQYGKTLPTSQAYALDAAGLLNSPGHAVEVAKLRADLDECQRRYTEDTAKLKARVAEMEAAAEAESCRCPEPAPLCEGCRCRCHSGDGHTRTADEDPIAYTLTEQAEDASQQRQQVRELIGRQRAAAEDPHDSPLHHTYAVCRDLPEVTT